MNRSLLLTAAAACLLGGVGLVPAFAASPAHSSHSMSSISTSSASTKTAAHAITIKNMTFSGSLKVKEGTKITVVNHDSEAHTLTSKSGGTFTKTFNTGTIDGGKSKTFLAPMKAGTYKFGCRFHPDMHGTLTVTK
jgi:plastocyanin